MVINLNAAEKSPKGKMRKCLLDLVTRGGHWLSEANCFGLSRTMEEMMVGGGVNEPREEGAVRAGGPRSGEVEEVTEPSLGSAGWEPWKDRGQEFRNQQGGSWELNRGPGSMDGMELDGRKERAC